MEREKLRPFFCFHVNVLFIRSLPRTCLLTYLFLLRLIKFAVALSNAGVLSLGTMEQYENYDELTCILFLHILVSHIGA